MKQIFIRIRRSSVPSCNGTCIYFKNHIANHQITAALLPFSAWRTESFAKAAYTSATFSINSFIVVRFLKFAVKIISFLLNSTINDIGRQGNNKLQTNQFKGVGTKRRNGSGETGREKRLNPSGSVFF